MATPAFAATDDSADALNALVRARLAEEAGQPAVALSALGDVSSLAPDLPGLRARMLEQAIQAGDLDAARRAASAVWASGDQRFDAQLVLTVDALRRSDWKAARAYLAAPQDKAGVDVIARLITPTISAWIDVGARAKQPERHLIAASPVARPEPALQLEPALVQIAAGRPDAAVALLRTITPTDRSSQLVAMRVVAALRAADRPEVAEQLERRIALAQGDRDDPLVLLPERAISTPRGGVAHWLALLADGIGRTPHGSPAVPLMFARSACWLDGEDGQVRLVLVDALVRNGQHAEALALLGKDGDTVPPVLAMRRAELIADAGEGAKALQLAEQAAAADDTPRSLLLRYADLARQADDDAAAERAYRRLEASLGDEAADGALRATVLVARADLALRTDGWDAAKPLIDRALALRPDDPMILNFAGYSALERRKNVDASLKMIEAAWEREPQNPSITDSLGWAYVLTGRIEEAVPLLEQAQRGEPENAVIVEHLGDAYWTAGRKFSARYVWRAAALVADADMATRIETKLRDGLSPATLAP